MFAGTRPTSNGADHIRRPTASATARKRGTRSAKTSGTIACSPSLRASCGESCTSIMMASAPADFFKEREVLHVTCPNLKTIRIFLDHAEVARVHDFSDDGQAGLPAGFGQEAQAIFAQSLEAVG